MEYKRILLPDNLSRETERYIKKVINSLKEEDKLNVIDEGILYLLAESHNQYIKATERVNEEGMTIAGSRNTIVVHPCVRIAKDNKATCLSIMSEMGLTLKARKNLEEKVKQNENEIEEKSPLENFFGTITNDD